MADISYRREVSREFGPHIEWIELHADGILHECAIMKRYGNGNVLFFRTNDLDDIDKRRLSTILMDRNARSLELWDIMAQKTLGNGMNALSYFHQLVRQLTPNGKIMDPKTGQVGSTGTVTTGKSSK